MAPRSARRLAAVASVALLLGAAACSDDDGDSAARPSGSDGVAAADPSDTDDASTGDVDSDVTDPDDDFVLDLHEDEDGRPFGADDSVMATAMKAGTGADRVEVDGSTFRLIFDDGSVDSVSVTINCTAMQAVKGDEDSVVLVYPDGEVACDDV